MGYYIRISGPIQYRQYGKPSVADELWVSRRYERGELEYTTKTECATMFEAMEAANMCFGINLERSMYGASKAHLVGFMEFQKKYRKMEVPTWPTSK